MSAMSYKLLVYSNNHYEMLDLYPVEKYIVVCLALYMKIVTDHIIPALTIASKTQS